MEILNVGLLWLTLNIYHEARGEDYSSQVDIANVVLNRVESKKYPGTIKGVVTQGGERRYRCQFSWFCDGLSDTPYNKKAWVVAIRAAETALSGYDTTNGALFYYNPKKASPNWAREKELVKISGNHVLLK